MTLHLRSLAALFRRGPRCYCGTRCATDEHLQAHIAATHLDVETAQHMAMGWRP